MKTGDKVIVPAEISGYGRGFTGNGYRDREVRRGQYS